MVLDRDLRRILDVEPAEHGPQDFTSTFNGSITDPGQGCTIVLEFFQTILAMPPDDSAKILRSFARAGQEGLPRTDFQPILFCITFPL